MIEALGEWDTVPEPSRDAVKAHFQGTPTSAFYAQLGRYLVVAHARGIDVGLSFSSLFGWLDVPVAEYHYYKLLELCSEAIPLNDYLKRLPLRLRELSLSDDIVNSAVDFFAASVQTCEK